MSTTLANYREEVKQELLRILNYWKTYAIETDRDGFYGVVDSQNKQDAKAPKSVVINSRILWTFSAAHQLFPNDEYPRIAKRAYDYIINHFIDQKNGGVYWSVTGAGEPLEKKKQLYGHAFVIYGLSEYYKITKDQKVLQWAIDIFSTVVKNAYDPVNGGYIEAFEQDWKDTNDYILSKPPNTKSMNTHLHLLEAFTNLCRVWKNDEAKFHLRHSINVMLDHIIDPSVNSMTLFFTDDWKRKAPIISYGHDIECSWLLKEAAEVLGDKELLNRCDEVSISLAKASADGLAIDGSMYYELDTNTKHLNKNRHWWPQAEAMVGFYNAYQLTQKVHYLEMSEKVWDYVKKYIIDHQNGEWYAALDENNKVTAAEKISFWKCPYHNGRACIELFSRLAEG